MTEKVIITVNVLYAKMCVFCAAELTRNVTCPELVCRKFHHLASIKSYYLYFEFGLSKRSHIFCNSKSVSIQLYLHNIRTEKRLSSNITSRNNQ